MSSDRAYTPYSLVHYQRHHGQLSVAKVRAPDQDDGQDGTEEYWAPGYERRYSAPDPRAGPRRTSRAYSNSSCSDYVYDTYREDGFDSYESDYVYDTYRRDDFDSYESDYVYHTYRRDDFDSYESDTYNLTTEQLRREIEKVDQEIEELKRKTRITRQNRLMRWNQEKDRLEKLLQASREETRYLKERLERARRERQMQRDKEEESERARRLREEEEEHEKKMSEIRHEIEILKERARQRRRGIEDDEYWTEEK